MATFKVVHFRIWRGSGGLQKDGICPSGGGEVGRESMPVFNRHAGHPSSVWKFLVTEDALDQRT